MLITTIIAGCTQFVNTRLRADDSGLLSAPLSQAQKTNDLFVFFNFEPIGRKSLSDGSSVISFKPTGDAFRALVTLEATTAADGTIQKLHLIIARSFIDDSAKCVYAADLAKSFLLNAAATSDGDEVTSLAREIEARAMARFSGTVIATSVPQTSATPSTSYRIYAGNSGSSLIPYKSGWNLLLHNDMQVTDRNLELTVAHQP